MLIKNLTKIPHIQWIHHVSTRLNHINYSYSCKPKTFIRISWHFNSFSSVTEHTNIRTHVELTNITEKMRILKKNTPLISLTNGCQCRYRISSKLDDFVIKSSNSFELKCRLFARIPTGNVMLWEYFFTKLCFCFYFLFWIYFLEKTPVIWLPSE